MAARKRVWITFGVILILAALAGLVDYPKGPDMRIGKYFKELKVHLGLDLQGGALLTYQADMSRIPAADRQNALDGARDVIERRVNAFGVSEPVVQTQMVGGSERIIVELPGVTDVNTAIAKIGKTPLLEFREQAPPKQLTDAEKKQIQDFNVGQKKKVDGILSQLKKGADFAALANASTEDPGNAGEDGVKKGGDLGFVDPANYVAEFKDTLLALKDGEMTQQPVKTAYGYHIIKRVASRPGESGDGNQMTEIRASHILLQTRPEEVSSQPEYINTGLSGSKLKSASVTFDTSSNAPQVSLVFNSDGTKLFAEITKKNLNKVVGIFLDGEAISLPTVQTEITNGEAVITGNFTLQEAKQLATNLNAGALPVPITLVSQQTVGASLGQSSVERSFMAGVVGILLVSLFMVLYYRLPGLLAVGALMVYSLIVLAIFKLWPVTLTLPGIAGFILSIGMAVDANVLVFERTKEELRAGKPIALAVEQGFHRAWLSIRDSNISSIITCVILTWFGTSLIRGFALTLVIGILISMFSAITVTRTFLRLIAKDRLLRHPWLLGTGSLPTERP